MNGWDELLRFCLLVDFEVNSSSQSRDGADNVIKYTLKCYLYGDGEPDGVAERRFLMLLCTHYLKRLQVTSGTQLIN